MPSPVTIYYLEMLAPEQLRAAGDVESLALGQVSPPDGKVNRFFYTTVGGPWNWHEKLPWTIGQWQRYAEQAELQTWVATVDDAPCGYFELQTAAKGDVEITYFGLLPNFVGRGLGGALLTAAIRQAWQDGARRVWLHTCSDDHPAALANYQSRGFEVYRTEECDSV